MSESDPPSSSPPRLGSQSLPLQDYDKELNPNGQPLTKTARDGISVARQDEINYINQPFRNIESESKQRVPQPIYDDHDQFHPGQSN